MTLRHSVTDPLGRNVCWDLQELLNIATTGDVSQGQGQASPDPDPDPDPDPSVSPSSVFRPLRRKEQQ